MWSSWPDRRWPEASGPEPSGPEVMSPVGWRGMGPECFLIGPEEECRLALPLLCWEEVEWREGSFGKEGKEGVLLDEW